MAQVIGNVKSFEAGTFFAKSSDGQIRQLKMGDSIYDGENVYGASTNGANARIVIDVLLAGAGDLVIGGDGALAFDTSVLAGMFSHNDAVVYVNSVKEALATVAPNEAAAGADTTDAGETAAGTTVTDTERGGDLFAARTGAVGDVATGLLDPIGGMSGVEVTDARPVILETPTINVPTIDPVSSSVDEEGLGGESQSSVRIFMPPMGGNPGDSYDGGDLPGEATTVIGQALNINWGPDAPGSVTFNAVQEGLSGLTSGGEIVNYTLLDGSIILVGYIGTAVPTDIGDESVVFYAKLNNVGSGTYDFALLMPLDHPVGGTEDDVTMTFAFTATDAQGDSASSTFGITVDDDAPVIGTYQYEDEMPSLKEYGGIPSLNVDESDLSIGVTTNFSGSFDNLYPLFGADGPAGREDAVVQTYKLDVNAGETGLVDSLTREDVVLSVNDSGVVEGRTVLSDLLVFTVSVDAAGNVTLDQDRAVVHDSPDENGDSNEAAYLNDASLITLTRDYTVTDYDKDSVTNSQSINIGDAISFSDDGPFITLADASAPALTVDESAFATDATEDFSGLFTTALFGADGPAASDSLVYTLDVNAGATGLVDTATGQDVVLVMNGSMVEGQNTDGDVVFTVSVDGSGNVTLDQQRAVMHDTPDANGDLSEPATLLNAGLITLSATATDADGDTSVANADISGSISFLDDGPSIQAAGSNSVAEGYSSVAQDDVVLILDRSGSMAGSISSVKSGVQDLLDSGHVHAVFIASFAKDGAVENGGAWYNVTTPTGIAAAMAAVDHVYTAYTSNSGGTDYDAALATVRANFTAPPAGGNRLISVFMSDGEPNEGSGGDGINVTEEGVWINFLQSNGFAESYAIGFGSVTVQDSNYLEPIAWTSSETAGMYSTGAADANVMVLDVTQLGETLVSITHTPNSVSGELLSGASAGADGWAEIPVTSATVNGELYTFTSAADSHTFTLENNAGSVTIYGNGHYDFTGSTVDLKDDASGVVSYTLKDGDGDTTVGSLTLTTTDSSEVYAYDNENGAQITQETIPGTPITQILADFSGTDSTPSGSAYNPWIFDHSGGTQSVFDLGSTAIGTAVSGNTDKWIISSQTGSSLDAGVEAHRLVIQDNNGASAGSAKLLTPLFTVAADGTTLNFDYERGNVSSSDSVTWQLYKQSGSTWSPVDGAGYSGSLSGSTSGEQTITSGLLNTGNYRIYFSVNDGGGSSNSRLYLDDIRLIVPGADIIQTNIVEAVGNVLTDPNTLISSSDAWGAMDDKGSEGAVVSSVSYNGTVVDAGTVINGAYGALVINSDGAYTYTPDATAVAGQQDIFTYTLIQPDGDSDTANLVINIDDSAYVASTPILGTDDGVGNYTFIGTDGNDVILGNDGNDTLYGNDGNDHIEGGAGNDMLDGGAGSDILLGGEGNDTLVYDAQDSVVDGGSGVDTLILTNGSNIDFGVLDSNSDPITNIQIIDLSLNGDHQLQNISHQDVVDITGGGNTLTILGDTAADTVTVDNTTMDYEGTSTEVFNGVSYDFDIYTSSIDPTVTLRVESIITDSII